LINIQTDDNLEVERDLHSDELAKGTASAVPWDSAT
jgi:hypothetical protein